MIEIKITAAESGGRMDKYLLKVLDKAPKNFVYKMLRKKNIVLNKKKSAGNEILKEGDIINLFLADETYAKFHTDTQQKKADKKPKSPSMSLEQIRQLLAYEDDNILAFNKPAGLLSQKAKPTDTSINDLLVSYLEETGFTGPTFVPGISNRLDRNTSGLVLAGKNPASSRELNNSIRDRSISKIYLALVSGDVKEAKTVEGYLIKDEKKNTVTVRKTLPEGESDHSCRLAVRKETEKQYGFKYSISDPVQCAGHYCSCPPGSTDMEKNGRRERQNRHSGLCFCADPDRQGLCACLLA